MFTAWQEEQGKHRSPGQDCKVASGGSAEAGKETTWGCTRAAVGAVAGEEPE